MEDFLKAMAEEAGKLQCELNLELKITLSDGRVITKSATSEVEARNIIRYFHEEERKLQYELLRKNNSNMAKVLTNLRDEIIDICEDYKDTVKLSMVKLKNNDIWKDGVYIRLHVIQVIDPNAKYQKSNDVNESRKKECSDKIYNLVKDKYRPIFQAYGINYDTWPIKSDTLIRLTSDNSSYEEFWVSLWDKYYEELSLNK